MSGESVEEEKEGEGSERLPQSAAAPQAVEFDWGNKWLKGDEYYHILTHADLYIRSFNLAKYPPKTHPITTYNNPKSTFALNDRWRFVFCRGAFGWLGVWVSANCNEEEV
eukprot:TRINITY_DN1468_c0_g1_i5.p1 TRINITY_DN1468_c0_g1~~TRINITY_DN1468_c0_g1_i5.p1  ORF type:complete len:110 (-),score=22.09 TRINITY_DN1468_c0_g1_i5:440-769(-)